MRKFPAIKSNVFTVCIFGFPNVGKSTLLSKMTSSDPEIKSYAFTTKSLNLGYINYPGNKIQIIDTPGTLNRPNKMNNIEFQAYIALQHVSHLIVYMFDPTESLYDIKQQHKLYSRAKKYKKELITYVSKKDISDSKLFSQVKEKYNCLDTPAELSKTLLLLGRNYYKNTKNS